jgi:signal-transduction protein with cAMP-binding, CBS, and nucleotidyltransferase domain
LKSRRKSPVNLITTEPHNCSIHLRLNILSHLPFFAGLSREEMEAVNQHFVDVGYEPGETIYRADDPTERLFVVADGKVKLLQHGVNGRNVLLDILTSWVGVVNLRALEGLAAEE